MTAPVTVLHLRQAEGGGGGADTGIAQLLSRAVACDRFRAVVAYLHKPDRPIDALQQRLRAIGVTVADVPGGRWFDRRQWRRLIELVDGENVGIVHSHDNKSDMLAVLLRLARPELRIVATLRGWMRRSAKDRLYERIDQWLLRRFDARTAVSQSLRREGAACGVGEVTVIANAIDTAWWTPPPAPPPEFTIGFVGRLSREKGPAALLRAAAALPADCRIVVAGDGPEQAAAERLAGELGMAERVHFVGHLPREQLPAVYRTLSVLALPSATEGMPNSLLEAGAMGLPSVAFGVGGVEEVLVHEVTGLVVPPADTAAFAAALHRLHDDTELRSWMGRQARRRIEGEFSLDRLWPRYRAVYEAVLANRAPP